MPKITVILPSLNVAAYIRECLESVMGQTMTDMEILCIDAGSTDGTCEIIREYADRDTPSGVETNLMHAGKSEDVEGDYEATLCGWIEQYF